MRLLVPSNDSAPRFEGQRIKAKCEGWSRYFDGEITRVNSDGTYDILFDDGESKSGVKGSQIHDLEVTPQCHHQMTASRKVHSQLATE